MANPRRFTGQVAFVTGAASGIGRATAVAFAREGARVAAADQPGTGSEGGIAEQAGFAAAKHAVIGLTTSAALETIGSGIQIKAVAPGVIHTAMTARITGGTPDSTVQQEPIRRLGRSEEIASPVLWLSSHNAAFTVAHALVVNGGQTLG